MKLVLKMSFFTLGNANIQFANQKLTWKTYTTAEALPTTQWIELIDKKKFAKAILDENIEAFVVCVAFFTLKIIIHPAQEAQIALLLTKEVIIPEKYSDFADIFSKESAEVLPKCTRINEHAIELQEDK